MSQIYRLLLILSFSLNMVCFADDRTSQTDTSNTNFNQKVDGGFADIGGDDSVPETPAPPQS